MVIHLSAERIWPRCAFLAAALPLRISFRRLRIMPRLVENILKVNRARRLRRRRTDLGCGEQPVNDRRSYNVRRVVVIYIYIYTYETSSSAISQLIRIYITLLMVHTTTLSYTKDSQNAGSRGS